jgi:hypothetical protein
MDRENHLNTLVLDLLAYGLNPLSQGLLVIYIRWTVQGQ